MWMVNPLNMDEKPDAKVHIGQGTYVSIGFTIALVLCTIWIKTGLNDNSNATLSTKTELLAQYDKLDTRLKNVEAAKNSWSAVDMFKWAVHLQQSNPQIKVPEPEVAR